MTLLVMRWDGYDTPCDRFCTMCQPHVFMIGKKKWEQLVAYFNGYKVDCEKYTGCLVNTFCDYVTNTKIISENPGDEVIELLKQIQDDSFVEVMEYAIKKDTDLKKFHQEKEDENRRREEHKKIFKKIFQKVDWDELNNLDAKWKKYSFEQKKLLAKRELDKMWARVDERNKILESSRAKNN